MDNWRERQRPGGHTNKRREVRMLSRLIYKVTEERSREEEGGERREERGERREEIGRVAEKRERNRVRRGTLT